MNVPKVIDVGFYAANGYAVLEPRGIRDLDASDLERAVPVEVKAGQHLVIHPQVIHGSGRNHSGRDRIALLFSYQLPKPSYDAFWAGAGMRFSVGGMKKWEPLAVAP